ncbi:hypothetical protein BH09ACT4_BH09ACT4_03110 [soil metagenome]
MVGRRRRVLVVVSLVVGAAVLLGSGWLIAKVFESPAQQEASATAPPPGDVTAEVTLGPLADTITVSVDVGRASEVQVLIAAAGERAVVTGRPVADGGRVRLGRPVLEVNGRPLILITGKFPMYRDLTEGDEGPDVRQLQKALVAAGFRVTVDGRFGAGTTQAIGAMYRHLGYPAPDPIPATELVVVPRLPAQLTEAPSLGAVDDGATATVSAGGLVATASIPAEVAQRLTVELPVVLRSPDGTETAARISSVGKVDAESGEARLVLVPADDPFPAEMLGQTLLAVITVELVVDDALLVPSIAITPRGSANPVVVHIADDGSQREVRVRELGTLAGVSAIEPVNPEELRAGDRIKVG